MAAVPSIGRASQVEPKTGSSADATRSLYERFHGQILGFCMNQLGSREEAEDATQSTFLNAHRALGRGTRPDAESAWLFKIAHNVCLSRRRSAYRRRRVETPSDLQTVQDFLAAPQREGSDDLIRLTDALSHMPDNQRRAILLREWQGLSYREIADELDLSQPAVETLIFRARRALAQNLEALEPAGRSSLDRARKALDLSAVAAGLKAALIGSTAVKTAATAVAVTGIAVAATAPLAPKIDRAAPASVERAPAAGVALRPALHNSAPRERSTLPVERDSAAPAGSGVRRGTPANQDRAGGAAVATAPAAAAEEPQPEPASGAPEPEASGPGAKANPQPGSTAREDVRPADQKANGRRLQSHKPDKPASPGDENAHGSGKGKAAPPASPLEQAAPAANAKGGNGNGNGGSAGDPVQQPLPDQAAPGNSAGAPGQSGKDKPKK